MSLHRASAALLAALLGAVSGTAIADDDVESSPPDSVDWVWISAGTGWELVDLRNLDIGQGAETAELTSTEADGLARSVAVGFRLWPLALGIRGSWATLEGANVEGSEMVDFNLWSLAAEAELRSAIGRVEPYLLFGAGYRHIGRFDHAVDGLRQGLDVSGADVRLGTGLNVYAANWLSLGVRGHGALLLMSRQGAPVRDLLTPKEVDTLGEARARALEADDSSLGTSLSVIGEATLHF